MVVRTQKKVKGKTVYVPITWLTKRIDKGSKVEKVFITEPVKKFEEEYVDNNYWKLGSDNAAEVDVDALLAELED